MLQSYAQSWSGFTFRPTTSSCISSWCLPRSSFRNVATSGTETFSVIAIRGSIFIALVIFFPKVALLYAIAYMIMMTILRFMDSLQHDYPVQHSHCLNFDKPPRKGNFRVGAGTHVLESTHACPGTGRTGSRSISGFHNAHHDDMNVYRGTGCRKNIAKCLPMIPPHVIPLSCTVEDFPQATRTSNRRQSRGRRT